MQYHDITTAVPPRWRQNIRRSHFLLENVLTFAEPLMLSHFTITSQTKHNRPCKQRNGKRMCIQTGKKYTAIRPNVTKTNEVLHAASMRNKIKHWWNRTGMMRAVSYYSWQSVWTSPWNNFNIFTHSLCACVAPNCCDQTPTKEHDRKTHENHTSHQSWFHPRKPFPTFNLQSARTKGSQASCLQQPESNVK